MVEEEDHHAAALKALASVAGAFTSTHALAETFATLTSGRLEIQLTPAEATEVIDANIIQRLQMVLRCFQWNHVWGRRSLAATK
jgi:hypothetical protein